MSAISHPWPTGDDTMRTTLRAAFFVLLLLMAGCGGGGGGGGGDGSAPSMATSASANPVCTIDSTVSGAGTLATITTSFPCARYGLATTRRARDGTAVTMDYLVAYPVDNRTPKALVVLIGGTNFDMGITGNPDSMVATGSGTNFLVRTAQIFANAGYVAVALDRPSDMPSGPSDNEITNIDLYRVSVRHAIDIVTVANRVNTGNLGVFLIGTSRGAMSVVANNELGVGVGISSPVTQPRADRPSQLFVNDARYANLLPTAVKRPAMVLYNELDECDLTPPAASQALFRNIAATGVPTSSAAATGGVKVTTASGNVVPDPCQAYAYHAYLGIENLAVGRLTTWLDARVAALGANRHPIASASTVRIATPATTQIDLAPLARDADNDTLAFSLPYAASDLGGSLTLNGARISYTPPAGLATGSDRFVYVVSDGRGGVSSAVVTVEVGS